jgi:Tol biopolymer transport system component
MKKFAITLAAVMAIVLPLTGCGSDSKPLITYVARGSSDSTPHLFTFSGTTGTPTAVTIPIPSTAWYVASNNTATQVVYYRSDDAGYDLYLMGTDGTEKQLTTDGRSWGATFSPDGKTIAYVDYTNGPDQIYVMNADGSNQHALFAPTTDAALVPAFSSDGKSLVFYVANGELAANVQSHNQHVLVGAQRTAHRLAQPQIADPSQSGWYTMALTDTAPTLVYASNAWWWGPASFSTDGTKLLFTMNDSNHQYNIFSVNLDGSNLTQLTTGTTEESLSPVAYKNLIFYNQSNSTSQSWDIYVMDETGGNQTLVNSTPNTYEGLLDAYYSED